MNRNAYYLTLAGLCFASYALFAAVFAARGAAWPAAVWGGNAGASAMLAVWVAVEWHDARRGRKGKAEASAGGGEKPYSDSELIEGYAASFDDQHAEIERLTAEVESLRRRLGEGRGAGSRRG